MSSRGCRGAECAALMQNRHATRTEHGNAQHNSSADSARGMYHDASAQGIDSSVDLQCPSVGVNAAFMIKLLLAGTRTLGGLARTQQQQQQEVVQSNSCQR